MTSDQALAGLASLVGGGGLSAVMVALLGYMTETRKGRRRNEGAVGAAVIASLGGEMQLRAAVGHLAAISYVLTRMAAVREIVAEEAYPDDKKDFGDRLENKTMRLLAEIGRHEPPPSRP